jgi:phospholipid/cholesterol/gamma-HCH transport system substrate-binding protein
MKKFTLETKVGVFVLVCLAIFAYAWFSIVGVDFDKGFELKAHFDSVEGLTKGVQVQIAGIKVGTIKDIRYDKDTGKALVTMEIKKEYEDAIPEDSRVMLRTKGLLGDKYLVIQPGRPNARKLKGGDELTRVHEPMDTEKVIETIGIASQDLKALARSAREQMIDKEGAQKTYRTIENAEKLFGDMKELVAKNKGKINSTLDGLDSTTKNLNQLVARNQKKINRTVDRFERFSGSMDKTGNKFDKVATDLERLTKDVRSGRGTLGKLIVDESLHREATSLIRDIRQLSSRIQNGPGTISRLINDPEIYFEARRAIRNMNKTAEDVSEATPVSTLAIILGSVFR